MRSPRNIFCCICAAVFAPGIAQAETVEINIYSPVPSIIVVGNGTEYTRVSNRLISYKLGVTIERPKNMVRQRDALLRIGETLVSLDSGQFTGSRVDTYSVPVMDVAAWVNPSMKLSPVRLCNDEIKRRGGNARRQFLRVGGTLMRHSAYTVSAIAVWDVREKRRWPRSGYSTKTRVREAHPQRLTVRVICSPMPSGAQRE